MRQLLDLVAEAQSGVTQTKAFRRWFAGSKVVDAAGAPLRCYHGTTADFATFSHDDAPDRGGLLAFFSTDPEFAGSYAERENGRVVPVYLRILEPYDFRRHKYLASSFWDDTGGIFDRVEANRILIGLGHPIESVFDEDTPALTEDDFVRAVNSGSWDALEAPEYVRYVRQSGYDGVILLENGSTNFGIFDASQVKSAITLDFY